MRDVYIYEPNGDREPTPSIAIATSNALASDPEGDTGDNAQAIANRLGVLVLAQRRPLSGKTATFDLGARRMMRAPDAYVQAAREAGRQLAKACAEYGIKDLYHVGHSAAASHQAGIVHTETTPAKALLVTDPAAMEEVPPFVGQLAWATYTVGEALRKSRQQSQEEALGFHQTDATPAKVFLPRQAKEIFVHGGYWREDDTMLDLREIARQQKTVATHVIFPEHSPNNFRNRRDRMIHTLNVVGSESRNPDDAPFTAEVISGAWHSTYDKPGPVADLVLAKFPAIQPSV